MMIEQLLQEVKDEVQMLRAELASMRDVQHMEQQPSGPVAVPDSEPEPQPEEPAEPEQTDQTEAPTRQDVSNLCLSMTRDGTVSKKALLDLIAEFNGARSVKEVPEASIPDLYARLKEQK